MFTMDVAMKEDLCVGQKEEMQNAIQITGYRNVGLTAEKCRDEGLTEMTTQLGIQMGITAMTGEAMMHQQIIMATVEMMQIAIVTAMTGETMTQP